MDAALLDVCTARIANNCAIRDTCEKHNAPGLVGNNFRPGLFLLLLICACAVISISAQAQSRSYNGPSYARSLQLCENYIAYNWYDAYGHYGSYGPPSCVVTTYPNCGGTCVSYQFQIKAWDYSNSSIFWFGRWPYDAPDGSPQPAKINGASCSCVGDPIDPRTGNEYRDERDFDLSTLSFHRYYNSTSTVASSHIGAHWRHSFDASLAVLNDGTNGIATAYRPDGKQFVFTLQGGLWLADPDVADSLAPITDGSGNLTGWLYVDTSTRFREYYSPQGVLLSIADTNGRVTTLTYSTASTPSGVAPTAGLLLTVTDAYGRSIHLTYNANGNVAAIALPDGGSLGYGYDANANLTSVSYPDGKSRQYVYNESTLTNGGNFPNALTGDIDEAGVRFSNIGYGNAYGNSGMALMSNLIGSVNPTQVDYFSGPSVTYPTGITISLRNVVTDGTIHTSAVNAPCGPLCGQPNASATYDANGHLASTTDFNGNVVKLAYDVDGLLDQQIDASDTPSQRTTNLTWDSSLRVPLTRTVLDAQGNTVSSTQWLYNTGGQTLARCESDPADSAASGYTCSNTGTVPAGVRRWTYSYCTAVDTTQCPIVGLMLTATGPRTDTTQTTTYSYYLTSSAANCGTPGAACYQAGDLHTITDPQGYVTTIASYDADGRVTRVTDANGVNTDMTYTPRGWLASRSVGGAATRFTYTPYGAVQTVTDPDGVTTTYGYDPAHRLVKVTDAQGNAIQYTLDAAGNKTAEQVYDATGTLHKSLTRSFNTLGQLTKVMDGLNHTIFDASASNSYDANGNLVQSADGLGIQRQLGYDALNRLVQTIDNYNGTN